MSGIVSLRWKGNNNDEAVSYEVQRSDDETKFETVSTIDIHNADHASEVYTSMDAPNGVDKNKFYRIRQTMKSGINFYSNVVKVNVNFKINLVDQPTPNPFVDKFSFNAILRADNTVRLSMIDESGRLVYQRMIKGQAGINKFSVENLMSLNPGVYLVEIKVEDVVIRQKLIKR